MFGIVSIREFPCDGRYHFLSKKSKENLYFLTKFFLLILRFLPALPPVTIGFQDDAMQKLT
jgi:hypothetical protein